MYTFDRIEKSPCMNPKFRVLPSYLRNFLYIHKIYITLFLTLTTYHTQKLTPVKRRQLVKALPTVHFGDRLLNPRQR